MQKLRLDMNILTIHIISVVTSFNLDRISSSSIKNTFLRIQIRTLIIIHLYTVQILYTETLNGEKLIIYKNIPKTLYLITVGLLYNPYTKFIPHPLLKKKKKKTSPSNERKSLRPSRFVIESVHRVYVYTYNILLRATMAT